VIPDAAFLMQADTYTGGNEDTTPVLPALCGAPVGADAVATRIRTFWYQLTPSDTWIEGVAYTQVTVFAGDGARRHLAAVRAAVAACPSEVDEWGDRLHYSTRDEALPGDESFTFVGSGRFEVYPDVFADRERWYRMVRVGDAVLVLTLRGWEDKDLDEQRAEQILDRALTRFVDWAGARG
jgi:hypothetical protein